jgi:PhnB protein
MTTKVSFVPKDASVISPYLVVRKAAEMLDFYKKVFGAIENLRLNQPDGRIGHAEISIGGASIMLADEFPERGIVSPITIGAARSPVGIHVYVEDIDAVYKKALAAGATSLREPANQFYGDRNAQVIDPSGHLWDISTHIEDVSAEEIQKRLAAMPQPER